MTKAHFYDIECLNNIFTLTNYFPEENLVEQYYLASSDLKIQIKNSPDLLEKLTDRVRLRNHNFTPKNKTQKVGNGTVKLYDLSTVEANIHLAREFGMSTAKNINDPTDISNVYPNSFRITCDTDLDNKTKKWNEDQVYKRYYRKLDNHNYNATDFINNDLAKKCANLKYHQYDENKDAYLFGYNSTNYDLTILAIYLQDTFKELSGDNIRNAKLYSHNLSGYHYWDVKPDYPETLRKMNNYMFSSQYKDHMASILYHSPENMNLRRAFEIRKNMLMTGRHLDVSRLNEKMHKVGLKRLLGMFGYQILESSKLKPGTDHITNMDQFYELLAYNASDCINLKCLFDNQYYQGQFTLKKSMIKTYPMIVYQKQNDKYAAHIAPDTIKRNRATIDSSSAQIATNVVCPYGHLNDIPCVSFNYPEKRKAKEVGIAPFNVLKQTREFFKNRVYLPAKKKNPEAAEKALKQFNRIMDHYAAIEFKNFNDCKNYYAKQLENYNVGIKKYLWDATDKDYANMLNGLNTFDLLSYKHQKFLRGNFKENLSVIIPQNFIAHNKIAPNSDFTATTAREAVAFFRKHYRPINSAYMNKVKEFITLFEKYSYQATSLASFVNQKENSEEDRQEKINQEMFDYQKFVQLFQEITQTVFFKKLTLESYNQDNQNDWGNAKIFEIIKTEHGFKRKPLYKLVLRPYKNDDLKKDNYCIPFFNADCTPSSGYALFSLGGIHGAEYNMKLYQEDHQETQTSLFSLNGLDTTNNEQSLFEGVKRKPKAKKSKLNADDHPLFKITKNGTYELNKRYTYTSIDFTNHEDFSSYYPSMCRMLNVYWNDGIGKDIYGEVYDRKEKLGVMRYDKKYTKEQRSEFNIMRNGTKLILNSTTGKGDSHGQNSPIQMNNNIMSMRLIGQMFTWRIGQAQTIAGAKVVSTNTDGLYTVLDDTELNAKILREESAEIHVRIDPERLYLISKDANNRVECDKDTLDIVTPSGGNLAAFNGPTATRALAHPAAIDRALGLYLRTIGDPESKYYDKKIQKPFNRELGMHLLKNLLGDVTKLPDKERLAAKHKLLNYYQNIISSSPGSDRYIFITHKLDALTNLNQDILRDKDDDNNELRSILFRNIKTINAKDYQVTQHYNRVFYVKDNGQIDKNKLYHVYIASGSKVSAKNKLSRVNNHEEVFQNSQLAEYILKKNGVDVSKLNSHDKEAKVIRVSSLPSTWNVILVNQSLASLDEEQTDKILDNLNWNNYLNLLETSFVLSWSNDYYYRKKFKSNKQKQEQLQEKVLMKQKA